MGAIKLWYFPGACSIAPHILLFETGLPFQSIEVSLTKESLEALRCINPKQRVPVLAIDDEVITETPAIMTALAQLVPEIQLLGQTNLETVRVQEWMNWLSGTLHGHAWGMILRPERYSDDASMLDAIKDKGMATAKELYEVIEVKLSGVYSVGNQFTVVDLYLYVFYRWAADRGMITKGTHPKLCQLASKLDKRPSVKRMLSAEGLPVIEL